jgi:electron transport complex protein RnfB
MDPFSVALWGIAVFTVVGSFFGVALAAAARRFHVPVDPVIEVVRDSLPSANCGACGFAGCQTYAEKVVGDPDVAPGLCTPGGKDVAISIGELTGKAVGEIKEEVAMLRCAGIKSVAVEQATYDGIRSCAAASLAFGGPKACKYGCLGLGDCIKACAFDAITPTDNGVVAIDPAKCTGCGLCVAACPKETIEMHTRAHRVLLACTTRDKAKNVKSVCMVGCTQCLQCIRKCPAKAIDFDDKRVITVDHKTCLEFGSSCNEICVEVCPTYILHKPGMVPVTERKKPKAEAKPAA